MFAVTATPRWQELSTSRAELERRLEVHRGAYLAQEAQCAELSVVRARNLGKALRRLEREQRQAQARLDTFSDAHRKFQVCAPASSLSLSCLCPSPVSVRLSPSKSLSTSMYLTPSLPLPLLPAPSFSLSVSCLSVSLSLSLCAFSTSMT